MILINMLLICNNENTSNYYSDNDNMLLIDTRIMIAILLIEILLINKLLIGMLMIATMLLINMLNNNAADLHSSI